METCVAMTVYINLICEGGINERGYSSVVERSLCMREASGSNPDISTSFFIFFSGFNTTVNYFNEE